MPLPQVGKGLRAIVPQPLPTLRSQKRPFDCWLWVYFLGGLMKVIATWLAAGAAGLIAVSGSQAARISPSKRSRSNIVKICSLYGAGFLLHSRHRHVHQGRRLC